MTMLVLRPWAMVAIACMAMGAPAAAQVTITTVSGNGQSQMSGDGGPALAASHGPLSGIARDGLGNIYVVEYNDYRIRKISPNGIITAFAGNGQPVFTSDTETSVGDGGPATAAAISPRAIAADAVGNVYFTDTRHHRVRKITPAGIISTLAGTGQFGYSGDGGAATLARLAELRGIAVDAAGNVYISADNAIRRISTGGTISRIAGSGPNAGFAGDGGLATSALLNTPAGLAVDATGNVFVADSQNSRIRRIGTNGVISTAVGKGYWHFDYDPRTIDFNTPNDVAVDAAGNLYVSAYSYIAKISPQGVVGVAGGFVCPHQSCNNNTPPLAEGNAFQAMLQGPAGLEIEPDGSLLIASDHFRVRRLSPSPPVPAPPARNVLMPYQSYSVDGTPDSVATGDFNGDGREDTAIVTRPFNLLTSPKPDDLKVLLYLQQPDGSLGAPVKSVYTEETYVLDPGLLMTDLNHDGRKDIVVNRQGLRVYLGNAQGILTRQDTDLPLFETLSQRTMVATDVDGDGNVDIVMAGRNSNQTYPGLWILLGLGDGGFKPPQFTAYPAMFSWWGPNEMVVGDLNNDGREDLLIGGINSYAGVYYHNGADGFLSGVALSAANQSPRVADLDDDGRPDALFARASGIPMLLVNRQDSSRRLDAAQVNPVEFTPNATLLADMNGDGRNDLVMVERGWGVSYLERTGSAYYPPRKYLTPTGNAGYNASVFAIGQLSGDACKDVAVASEFNGLLIYRGQNCQPPSVAHDLDADGRGDVAWTTKEASVQVWPGLDRSQSVILRPGAGWNLVAMADFDGDSHADMLWRNCINHGLVRSRGLAAPSLSRQVAGPDRSWRLVAAADFDGNRHADLLWQHASGATRRWPDGDAKRSQRGASLQPGWSVVASGDFDGDGQADVFWRHAPTGANLIWRSGGMRGALRVTAITDRRWQVVASGDADGDGRADLLWRHQGSGRNVLWPAAEYAQSRELQALSDLSWSVAAMTDTDADGRADVLWHHSSGLGLLWPRADPALARSVPATPRGWEAFDRADTCRPAPTTRGRER